MKRKKLKITGLVVLIVILVIFGGSLIYISDYYHSTEDLAYYQLNSVVNVQEEDSLIIVGDADNASTGIVFYPGGKVEYTAYIPLMEEIAKKGYVCFIVKMPGNLAVFGLNKADIVIEKYSEIQNWYIGGHSLGGAMASSYAEKNPDQLSGIFFLGAYPSSDLSGTDLKMISIVGSEDKVLNREKYQENKINAPIDAEYIEIVGGNHANFGNYGDQDGDGNATITWEEQIKETAEAITNWIM